MIEPREVDETKHVEESCSLCAYPNSLKWSENGNLIAMQTGDTLMMMNYPVTNEKYIIQWDAVPSDTYIPLQLRDRYISHSSIYYRYRDREFRSSEISPPIHHFNTDQTLRVNEFDNNLIAILSNDHQLQIFRRPDNIYQRHWEQLYDVTALLKLAATQFMKYEDTPAPKRRKLAFKLPSIKYEAVKSSKKTTAENGEGSEGTNSKKRKRILLDHPLESRLDAFEECVHLECVTDIMAISWSPIVNNTLYLACGSKSGSISILKFNPSKDIDDIELFTLIGYVKAHEGYISSLTFVDSLNDSFVLLSGSSDGSAKIWNVPMQSEEEAIDISELLIADNAFLFPDDIPVHLTTSLKYGSQLYVCFSKGCCLHIWKIDSHYELSSQISHETNSSITGIASSMCHYQIGANPILFVYYTSNDGSVTVAKVNDTDNTITTHRIVSIDLDCPAWGCALSPNQCRIAFIREKLPFDMVSRPDLEHRQKSRLYVYKVLNEIQHLLPQIDNQEVEYYVANMYLAAANGRQQRYHLGDIIDDLRDLDTTKILAVIDRASTLETSQQIHHTLLKLSYQILVNVIKPKPGTASALEGASDIVTRQNSLLKELIFLHATSQLHASDLSEDQRLANLLKCDWILFYLGTHNLQGRCDMITSVLVRLVEVYTSYSEQTMAQFSAQMLKHYHQPDEQQEKPSLPTDLIPTREQCPYCLHPETISLEGFHLSSCENNSRHVFSRDIHSFAILSEAKVATCHGCGLKTTLSNNGTECPICCNLFISRVVVDISL